MSKLLHLEPQMIYLTGTDRELYRSTRVMSLMLKTL